MKTCPFKTIKSNEVIDGILVTDIVQAPCDDSCALYNEATKRCVIVVGACALREIRHHGLDVGVL